MNCRIIGVMHVRVIFYCRVMCLRFGAIQYN